MEAFRQRKWDLGESSLRSLIGSFENCSKASKKSPDPAYFVTNKISPPLVRWIVLNNFHRNAWKMFEKCLKSLFWINDGVWESCWADFHLNQLINLSLSSVNRASHRLIIEEETRCVLSFWKQRSFLCALLDSQSGSKRKVPKLPNCKVLCSQVPQPTVGWGNKALQSR